MSATPVKSCLAVHAGISVSHGQEHFSNPSGFQLQNLKSNYLTQQKSNSSIIFSVSNWECESASAQETSTETDSLTNSLPLAEAESMF
jgi:hypothetical protein